jgi:hypothetical protein
MDMKCTPSNDWTDDTILVGAVDMYRVVMMLLFVLLLLVLGRVTVGAVVVGSAAEGAASRFNLEMGEDNE